MPPSSFAPLHAGLLARKGDARPSVEPPKLRLSSFAREPEAAARTALVSQEQALPAPAAPTAGRIERGPEGWRAAPGASPRAASAAPAAESGEGCSVPAPEARARKPHRTSVRLTHDQLRALRLAALVLDRPQQELLSEGLEGRLHDLACSKLSRCACFQKIAAALGS